MLFSKRLNELMMLAGISNISLARALSVDPSLVSRWRNGSRRLSNDPDTIVKITLFVVRKMETEYHRILLGKALGLENFEQMSDDELAELLVVWLGRNSVCGSGTVLIHEEELSPAMPPHLSAAHTAVAGTGPEGRRALIRRLYELYDGDESDATIRFYSNDPASWLKEDILCCRPLLENTPALFDNVQSVKVIIHSNTGDEELMQTINYVLPFLKNGVVQIVRAPNYCSEPFGQTVIIMGKGCAAASHSFNGSSNFMVDLFNNKPFIHNLSDDFDVFFDSCEKLHTIKENPTSRELISDMNERLLIDEPIVYIGNTIPGIMIPPSLYLEVGARISDIERDGLCSESLITEHRTHFDEFLKRNYMYVFVPLFSPSDVEDGAASMAYLPRSLNQDTELSPAEYLRVLEYLRLQCTHNERLILSTFPEREHEHYIMLQPHSTCYVVKNLTSSVVYKTEFAGFVYAFRQYVVDHYGSLDSIAGQHSQHVELLDKSIDTFRRYLNLP